MKNFEYKVICFGFDHKYVLEPDHMQELLNRAGSDGFELHSIKLLKNNLYCEKDGWYAFLKKPVP